MSASTPPPTAPPVRIGPLRRIVTGETRTHRSAIMLDGPPANAPACPERPGLFEIWAENLAGALDPQTLRDFAGEALTLSPEDGAVKARWFVVEPLPDHIPAHALKDAARKQFAALDAAHDLADQDRHPFMHRTNSLDIVVLLAGAASLVVDDATTRLAPGDVVVQRASAHAWIAHDGPALFLAVLIGREITRQQG